MTEGQDDSSESNEPPWDPPSPIRKGPRGHSHEAVLSPPESFMGRTAIDPQGDKIGRIGQVYVDDVTGKPDWVTVNTGLFGTKEHFAPLKGATVTGDDIVLPFDQDVVNDAPDVADASHLDPDEQDALYTYYAQYLSGSGPAGYRRTPGANIGSAATVEDEHEVVLHAEQPSVTTEAIVVERVRLGTETLSETQQVTGQVRREEVEVVNDTTASTTSRGADGRQ